MAIKATRPQAKAALDAAVTQMKTDIDTTLPAGVNIIRGHLRVNPTSWTLVMAVDTLADGVVLRDAIKTSLEVQSRAYTIQNLRRAEDHRSLIIDTDLATYHIIGY